jgi:hypothetical protein
VTATTAKVQEALEEAVKSATEMKQLGTGLDVAVHFHFSGHGHQWKMDGDDQYWQGLVCSDTAILKDGGDKLSDDDWKTFPGLTERRACLTSVDFQGPLKQANAGKVALSLSIDSCYSRKMVARGSGARVRRRAIAESIPIKVPGEQMAPCSASDFGREMSGKMAKRDDWLYISALSACDKDEKAIELQHPIHRDKSMGLLTSAMVIVFYDALVEQVKSQMDEKIPDADDLSWQDICDRSRGLFGPIVSRESRPAAGSDLLLPTPFATFNSRLQVFSSTKSHAAGHLRWRPSASLRTPLSGATFSTAVLELDQGFCELVVPGKYLLYRTVEENGLFEFTAVEEHISAHRSQIPLSNSDYRKVAVCTAPPPTPLLPTLRN